MILVPSIFDQRKQLFYDKIAKTVVMDHKPEECYPRLNYVYAGITRRVIAHIIDSLTIMGTSLVCLIFVGVIFHIAGFKLFITRSCLSFLLSIVFGVFMIRRFGGTPGQLLCGIHIKDADTLKNVTLVQAIIRHIPFAVIHFPILITRRKIFSNYTSEWWLDPLSGLIFMTIILILCVQCLTDASNFFMIKLQKQWL